MCIGFQCMKQPIHSEHHKWLTSLCSAEFVPCTFYGPENNHLEDEPIDWFDIFRICRQMCFISCLTFQLCPFVKKLSTFGSIHVSSFVQCQVRLVTNLLGNYLFVKERCITCVLDICIYNKHVGLAGMRNFRFFPEFRFLYCPKDHFCE